MDLGGVHSARGRVNGAFKNLWCLSVLREIANHPQSGLLPDPLCCFDQPMIDRPAETVPVSNPKFFLSLFPLVHRGRPEIWLLKRFPKYKEDLREVNLTQNWYLTNKKFMPREKRLLR